jgi:hypothetical protein
MACPCVAATPPGLVRRAAGRARTGGVVGADKAGTRLVWQYMMGYSRMFGPSWRHMVSTDTMLPKYQLPFTPAGPWLL